MGYSDKEVAVGTCEMSPEMFNEAVKITKDNIGAPTNAECASKIKAAFDEKYGGNWLVIVGEGYGLFLLTKQRISPISLLEKPSPLSFSRLGLEHKRKQRDDTTHCQLFCELLYDIIRSVK